MTLEETRARILESDDFVFDEFRRLQVLYGLKNTIRYHHTRTEEIVTESVADHVYAMHALIAYFHSLEDLDQTWNHEKIWFMCQFHDIDEIETGDIIGYMKTEAERRREAEAQQRIVMQLPYAMRIRVADALKEYEEHRSPEAQFVRAIDKVEPLFHLYNENGEQICQLNKTTYEQNRSIKDQYVEAFPYVKRTNEVMSRRMQEEGFFYSEA